MVTIITGWAGYLGYCIVGFLIKVVVLAAYAAGAALYFALKYSVKLLGYGIKFLAIVGCWIFTQLCLFYKKRRMKNENPVFYTEEKKIDL